MSLKKVVLHIGMGKTGSTAIQVYARKHKPALAAAGIAYGGMFFEELPVDGATDFISYLKTPRGERAKVDAQLAAAVGARLETLGAHTLFLSNESFYDHLQGFKGVLEAIAGKAQLELLVYLRNPVDWVWSAYLQWGVKHKQYRGRVMDADDWIAKNLARVSYGQRLRQLRELLPQAKLVAVSYDDCGDVVARCLEELGLRPPPAPTDCVEYPTPSLTAHAVMKLVNSQSAGPSLPAATLDMLGRAGMLDREFVTTRVPIPLPGDATLKRVMDTAFADLPVLHEVLRESANPKFYDRARRIEPAGAADITTVLALLIEVIGKLDARVVELEKSLGQGARP